MSAKKMWGGRFRKKADPLAEAFSTSLPFDRRLLVHDIVGSIAHAEMLARRGIIGKGEGRKIASGLRTILRDSRAGKLRVGKGFEDVHSFVEAELFKRIGEAAGKLHTARSRNDQVSLDLRLYLREAIGEAVVGIRNLQRALLVRAKRSGEAVLPAYTHLQHAQPVLFSHHLLAYVEKLERDAERFRQALDRTNVLPLGSGACAGTGLPIDREAVAEKLGFGAVSRNSLDAVSDRDFALDFLSAASILGVHLSRLAEELVLWSGPEFGFVEMDEGLCTGSPLMPQKRNPDMAELVRGKTGRLFGNLVRLLTVMKGLPLSYNRDMQEDKEAVFDTADAILPSLRIAARMARTLKVRKGRMAAALLGDFSGATDLAEYLVRRGLPFRKAHGVVGRLVGSCIEKGKSLGSLSIGEYRESSPLFEEDVYLLLDPDSSVRSKRSTGGTSPERVSREIRRWEKKLS